MEGDFRLGPWLVRPGLNTVARNGTTSRLTPKAMGVLVCLAERARDPVSKEKLLEEVWPGTFVGDDVLKNSIAEIRRALEDDAKEPRIIETIAKRGYRLIAPVEWVDEPQPPLVEQLKVASAELAAAQSQRKWWMTGVMVAVLTLLIALVAIFDVGGLRTRLRASAAPEIHSLAVLPLRNLSSDPSQEYLCDGLTDGLITDLAQIGSLKVISHTSTMQYQDTKKSLPQIARELNVDGILEGTVQRSGNRLRITTQLIHAPEDKHLWANTYERDMQDVFTLERDITADIAHEVKAHLAQRQSSLAQPRPLDPNVVDAYLQGNSHLNKYASGSGDEEKKKAAELFQQVVAAAPDFAPGYVGLAQAHLNLEQSAPEDLAIAKRAAEKAARLDPTSSDAWVILAEMNEENFSNWAEAEADYRKAISLNPNNALAHDWFGVFLGRMGRLDDGLSECEVAQQLDPNNDRVQAILYLRREYDRAIAVTQVMIKNHPDNGYLHVTLYRVYTKKGMYKEAVQELVLALRLFGMGEAATHVDRGFARSGYTGAIRQFAAELEHLHDTKQAFFPGNLALTYAALGEKDRAFYWLEQAYQHREIVGTDIPLDYLIRDPMADPLRSDPRFNDLVRRLGLPP